MKPTMTSSKSVWMLSCQPRHVSRVTNKPAMHMYLLYVVHCVYIRLFDSDHVFFDFGFVDPVYTDLST